MNTEDSKTYEGYEGELGYKEDGSLDFTWTDRVKIHFAKHKNKYILAGGAAVAGGAVVFLATRKGSLLIFNEPVENVFAAPVNMEIYAQGDPGNVIRNIETGEIFASQGRAAEAFGISPSSMSQHLNGFAEHAGGFTFERLGKAVVKDA